MLNTLSWGLQISGRGFLLSSQTAFLSGHRQYFKGSTSRNPNPTVSPKYSVVYRLAVFLKALSTRKKQNSPKMYYRPDDKSGTSFS